MNLEGQPFYESHFEILRWLEANLPRFFNLERNLMKKVLQALNIVLVL